MKKKIISVLVAAMFTVLMVPGSIADAVELQKHFTGEDGVEWGYQVDTEGRAIKVIPTLIPKNIVDITVPTKISGLTVTDLDPNSFSSNETLVSITLPVGLSSIDREAFRDCTGLKSITLPEKLITIGDMSFSGCSSLERVEIPNTVIQIGDGSFSDCTSLSEVKLSSSMSAIGSTSFKNDKSLKSISIPNSVNLIDRNAFYNCDGLINVSFEENSSLKEVGSGAFDGCSSIQQLLLPSKLENIGANSFRGTNSLLSLEIPTSVTSIGFNAFDRDGSNTIATVSLNSESYAKKYHWDESFNIKCLDIESPVNPLTTNALTVSREVGYIGMPIKLSSFTSGGNGGTQLLLEAVSKDSGRYVIHNFWSTSNTSYDWTPVTPGEYTIIATTRNFLGERVSMSKKYIVKDKESSSISIEKPIINLTSPIPEKSVIKIQTKASGGSGKFKYRYQIDGSNSSQGSTVNNTEYEWTAYTKGTYKITVTATEWDYVDGVATSFNSVTSEAIEVVVVAPIAITDLKANIPSPQKLGSIVSLSVLPFNGYGVLKTKFEVTKGTTTKTIKGYSTDTFTNWKPTEQGEYLIIATSIDERGYTTVRTLEYSIQGVIDKVYPLIVNGISCSLPSPQEEWTTVKLNAFSSGGVGEVKFKYEVLLDEILLSSQDFSDNPSFIFTAGKSGSYKIRVTAIDEAGLKYSYSTYYIINKKTVMPPEIKRFDTLNSKIELPIKDIETLSNGDLPFYTTFTRNGFIDLSINFNASKDVLSEMNRFIIKDLTFSFSPSAISESSFINSVDPKEVVSKFNINSNLSDNLPEMTFVMEVGKSYEGRTLFLYHVDGNNKFTFVNKSEVLMNRFSYKSKTLGNYILLDTEIENATLKDYIPVVVPPEVTVPKTADGNNLLVIAFLTVLSSTLLIITSSKSKRLKVKN